MIFKRDGYKAGAVISIFLVLFFSYGRIYDLVAGFKIGDFIIGEHRYLSALWLILFIVGVFFTIKTKANLRNLTDILNIFSITLVLFPLITIGIYNFNTRDSRQETVAVVQENVAAITGDKDKLPDIYYIVLDGYASLNNLQEFYNYDNNEFIEYLEKKGFFIARESKSNYSLTYLSLASSLNMEYINYLSDTVGIDSEDTKIPYAMIEDNRVINFLRSRGYKYIHFSSGWGATDNNPKADINISGPRFKGFQTLLIQTTMLKPFQYYIISDAREAILNNLLHLSKPYKTEEPNFIFYHMLVPHPPYLFDENGEAVPDAKLKMSGNVWKQKENYINQLIFINKEIKKVIDNIISESQIPPIIILQADHGTRSSYNYTSGEDPPGDMVKEMMGILNALYLPSGGDEFLYDSITPVNSFRLIFNFYFDADYELLDDHVYYSYYDKPYSFTEVVDDI